MNNSVDIEQAVNDLQTMLDMVRWAVSQFNQAGLFYGHGTCLLYTSPSPRDRG